MVIEEATELATELRIFARSGSKLGSEYFLTYAIR